MQTLRTILLVLFVLDSALLCIAILIQSGRGGGLAGALGGISGADSALGVRAASQIEKVTGLLVVIFFALAIGLAFVPLEEMPVSEPEREARATTEPAGAQMTSTGESSTPPAAATDSETEADDTEADNSEADDTQE